MNWLLENTLIAGIAAGVVLAVCRVCRPRPAFAHALWVLVLVKLLCPPVMRLPLPMDVPDLLGTAVALAPAPNTPPPPVHGAIPRLTTDGGGIPLAVVPDSDPIHGRTPGATLPSSTTAAREWSTWTWLALVWVFGSGVVLASMLIGIGRVERIRRRGTEAPTWLRRDLELLAGRLRIDAPRVVVSSCIGSAFVWGLGRPTLMWPASCSHDGDRKKARSVLAHELAHLKRRDHWTAWLEIAATAALWWHPLMWLARSRLRLQAELACDAWAVWAVPQGRHTYAGALIDAIENKSQAVTTVPVLAARPSARAFEKRLLMILHEDVPRRLSRRAVLPVAALSLTVFSGFSFAQDRSDRKEATSERAIQKEVLRTVNQHLRKSLGRKYQVESLKDIEGVVQRFVRDQQRDKAKRRKSDSNKRVLVRRRRSGGDNDEASLRRALEEARRELRQAKREKSKLDHAERRVKVLVHGDGDVLPKDLESKIEKALKGDHKNGLKGGRVCVLGLGDIEKFGFGKDIKVLLNGVKLDVGNFKGGKLGHEIKVLLNGVKLDVGNLKGGKLGHEIKVLDSIDLNDIIRRAMKDGLREAKIEIHKDGDLHRLGLTGDVEVFVEDVLGPGKQGEVGLEAILRNASKHGLRGTRIEIRKGGEVKRIGGNVEVRVLHGHADEKSDHKFEVILRKAIEQVERSNNGNGENTHRVRRAIRRDHDRIERTKKLKRKSEKTNRSKIL